MVNKTQLSLVLPVHNQAEIIESVVKEIVKVINSIGIGYEILMVENGSSDKTLYVLKQLTKKNNKLKYLVAPKGYGSAVIAGLKKSHGDYVSYMPSDGQLDPKLLIELWGLVTSSNYDMVKIRRITREGPIRFWRSKIFNILARSWHSIPNSISDINGSPRIFKRKWLKELDLTYIDSFIDTELAVKANYLHWRIKEISANTLPRVGGKSTVNYRTVIEFLRNILTFRQTIKWRVWYQKNVR